MGKKALTWEEMASFLEAAEARGPQDHLLACLCGLHGLDVSAVCGASVADVRDGCGRTLAVRVVGGTISMTIPLTTRSANALYRCIEGRSEGPVLVDDAGGPLSPAQARGIINAIARAAGLGDRLTGRPS